MIASDECFLFLDQGGQRWPCGSGDVIGRAGTVAQDVLRPVEVLSRRHLQIDKRGAAWYVTALAGARNATFIDGQPMERGVPYPLLGVKSVQVDTFQFYLGTANGMQTQIWSKPPDVHSQIFTPSAAPQPVWPVREGGLQDDSPGFVLEDETRGEALPPGFAVDGLPGAMVETDERLHVLCANAGARKLLGEEVAGRDFDTWTAERTRVRNFLLSLQEGTQGGPLVAAFDLPGGRHDLELHASRFGGGLLISLRDATAERDRVRDMVVTAETLARQSETLAEFSLSQAFQEGDVAKSLTLLTHHAAGAMGCRRVSVWLKQDPVDTASQKIVCQVAYDTEEAAASGVETDLAYCPMFFDRLKGAEPWAMTEEDSPVMGLLQQIQFAAAGTGQLLCVPLQQAENFYGVLCFERAPGEGTGWTREDRQFALCLASYGVLALQTSERREAVARLEAAQKHMNAELEEANRYVRRILPDPVESGPITSEWHMEPSEALGGDAFGYHWVGDLFVMYVLDVVGHGTGMALLSISVLNSVRARLLMGEAAMADPARVLAELNAAFPMENQNNMLFSMWYGVFDRRTRQLTYSSAGHPPALLLHGDCAEGAEDYTALGTEGPSVGAMEGVEFLNGHTTVDLGAKLYIYSDGAFEIPLSGGREWTFDEYVAVIRSTRYMSGGETAYLRKRIGSLCIKPRFPDDFTIVRFTFEE